MSLHVHKKSYFPGEAGRRVEGFPRKQEKVIKVAKKKSFRAITESSFSTREE